MGNGKRITFVFKTLPIQRFIGKLSILLVRSFNPSIQSIGKLLPIKCLPIIFASQMYWYTLLIQVYQYKFTDTNLPIIIYWYKFIDTMDRYEFTDTNLPLLSLLIKKSLQCVQIVLNLNRNLFECVWTFELLYRYSHYKLNLNIRKLFECKTSCR